MLSLNKKELRELLKTKRAEYPDKKLKIKSQKISDILINSTEYKESKAVFCYISFNKEIDTFSILNNAVKNKILAVPVIKNNEMICAKIDTLNNLEKNKYGIYEPKKYAEIDKDIIDLAVVPALAFNSFGYRLGYGGGYYDRFLQDFKGIGVGLVLKEFIVDTLATEEHDLPVDKIIIL